MNIGNFVENFHFIRPFWLLAFMLVPLLWLDRTRFGSQHWAHWLPSHLRRVLLTNDTSSTPAPSRYLAAILFIMVIVACAGPSWQKQPTALYQIKRATVLVLDLSLSMRATDVKPNRLTRAKFKADDVARLLPEGELALLAFAGDSFVISPLTSDKNNARLLIKELSPEIMPVQGSDLSAALTHADKLLKQAGYRTGDVVVITDGFSQSQWLPLQQQLRDYPHRVSMIGVGSSAGAPVLLAKGAMLKDRSGAIVMAKVPQQQLATLASLTQGIYVDSTADDSDVLQILDTLSPLQDTETADKASTEQKAAQWQDGGIYLVWLLLPLLFWAWRTERVHLVVLLTVPLLGNSFLSSPAAAAARTSVATTTSASALVTLLSSSTSAHNHGMPAGPSADAQDTPNEGGGSLWQQLRDSRPYWFSSREQQGHAAYQQQDYAAAKQHFNDPLWQGNAAYRQGDFAKAEQFYAQDQSANGHFNRGNALVKQGQFDSAIAAYQQALAQNPNLAAANTNLEIAKTLKERAQQQDGQSSDNSDGQSQPNPAQQNAAQQGSQQQSSQQQNSQPQDSQQQGAQQQNAQQDPKQQGATPQSQQDPAPSSDPQTADRQGSNASEDRNKTDGQAQDNASAEDGKTPAEQAAEQAADDAKRKAQQQAAIAEKWPNADAQESQQLENLLRKVQDDPSLLLRNKMYQEYQERRQRQLPPGDLEEW